MLPFLCLHPPWSSSPPLTVAQESVNSISCYQFPDLMEMQGAHIGMITSRQAWAISDALSEDGPIAAKGIAAEEPRLL